MPLKPPLSIEELRAIRERNPDNKDVKALLWEIRRYHVLMSRFYQLARSVPKGGAVGTIADLALNEMSDDPAVLDIKQLNEELFGQKSSPGDDD
jgi:hypothetical protein